MTRERCKELLPVITAWANGETIQLRDADTSKWNDKQSDDAYFESSFIEWRIKPKPLEVWAIVDAEGRVYETYSTIEKHGLESAQYYAKERGNGASAKVIKLREVEEGQ